MRKQQKNNNLFPQYLHLHCIRLIFVKKIVFLHLLQFYRSFFFFFTQQSLILIVDSRSLHLFTFSHLIEFKCSTSNITRRDLLFGRILLVKISLVVDFGLKAVTKRCNICKNAPNNICLVVWTCVTGLLTP